MSFAPGARLESPGVSIKVFKVVVRPSEAVAGVLLAIDENGAVEPFLSAHEVVRWVKRRDKRVGQGKTGVVTVLGWRDMPPEFVPPEV